MIQKNIASFRRAAFSGANGGGDVDKEFAQKLEAKVHESLAARDAALNEIIQDVGPIGAAIRANREENPQLMYRSILANDCLVPPHVAEPLTLQAWQLDQAAGRSLTLQGRPVVQTVRVDNALAGVQFTEIASLVTAIFIGTVEKTDEMWKEGRLPFKADNAGMLLFLVATKNDDVDLLQALYQVAPTFHSSMTMTSGRPETKILIGTQICRKMHWNSMLPVAPNGWPTTL